MKMLQNLSILTLLTLLGCGGPSGYSSSLSPPNYKMQQVCGAEVPVAEAGWDLKVKDYHNCTDCVKGDLRNLSKCGNSSIVFGYCSETFNSYVGMHELTSDQEFIYDDVLKYAEVVVFSTSASRCEVGTKQACTPTIQTIWCK
jgi:hypothetical protein